MAYRRCGWWLGSLLLALAEISAAQTTNTGATVYRDLSQTALAPVTFCAYSNTSPWRRRLPDNPTQKRPQDDANARKYITNAGQNRPLWITVDDKAYAGCPGGMAQGCEGHSGFSTFVASTSDPKVTFQCNPDQTNYGCWQHDKPSGAWTYEGYAPANLVPAWNGEDDDHNWAVVQPNGDVIEAYHCRILRPIVNGDVLSSGGGACNNGASFIGSMLLSNLKTDKGTNGGINSGPDAMIQGLKYAHTAVTAKNPKPQPNQAIWMNTSCNNNDFVYPATSSTRPCQNPGEALRTGAHLQLTLTFAQIDAAISAGQIAAGWRGVLYAAHAYGIYLGDTGGGLGDDAPAFSMGWLEDATQLVINGAHNPWLDWMQSLGSSGSMLSANPFLPFVDKIIVVEDCYATGTCPDSPAPDLDCGGYVSPRPKPTHVRLLP